MEGWAELFPNLNSKEQSEWTRLKPGGTAIYKDRPSKNITPVIFLLGRFFVHHPSLRATAWQSRRLSTTLDCHVAPLHYAPHKDVSGILLAI